MGPIDKEVMAKAVQSLPNAVPEAASPLTKRGSQSIMLVFGSTEAIRQFQSKRFGVTDGAFVINDGSGNVLSFFSTTTSWKRFLNQRPDKILVFSKKVPKKIGKILMQMGKDGIELLEANDA